MNFGVLIAGGYSLFGRVIELVLVGAAEALLDANVGPESLHRRQELLGERLRVLHPLDHVEHHLGVSLEQGTEQLT